MGFITFSKWAEIREQTTQQGATPQAAQGAASADHTIKRTITSNMGKPKKMQKNALKQLAAKMANDKNADPKELQKVVDLVGSEGDGGPAA
jgi:hypothetical protein